MINFEFSVNVSRTNNFIAISSFALLVILIMQLDWIWQTAAYKEDNFNEKASIIIARTTEALSADKEMSMKLEAGLAKTEQQKIDELLKYYMKYYNFNVDYSFDVIKTFTSIPVLGNASSPSGGAQPACYKVNLNKMSIANGWELKLNFPGRKEFIISEMGIPFITTVILILVVFVMFWKTVLIFRKERILSEHTTDFLNNMTHEFKTPLTSIALAGNMIMKEASNKHEEEIKQNSEIILEENEKLRLQVEQVLSMTALERGEIPIQKTELDVHQLIKDFLKSFNIQIQNAQVNLQLKLEAQRVVIMGDRTHLTNALRNLVDNAIKYSPGKPELFIGTKNDDNKIVIVVSDKGIGIGKEYHKKIFEKFFRIPKGDTHDVKGFGLGLSYIKKIVEMHEGIIELESEKGKGSTFRILLPNE